MLLLLGDEVEVGRLHHPGAAGVDQAVELGVVGVRQDDVGQGRLGRRGRGVGSRGALRLGHVAGLVLELVNLATEAWMC